MAQAIIQVIDLAKSYQTDGNTVNVFNNLSFEVYEGEVIAVVGPSGIGKSTLLNILGTLDRPTGGELFYDRQNPFLLNDVQIAYFRNRNVGFIFQFHHLLPEFTALENVMIPAMVYPLTGINIRQRAMQLLSEVGLSQRMAHRPSELSGGERQRVAVARALMNQPRVILADEPTGNLDLENSQRLIELLLTINRTYHSTFIIATHNPTIAECADRVIELTPHGINFSFRTV